GQQHAPAVMVRIRDAAAWLSFERETTRVVEASQRTGAVSHKRAQFGQVLAHQVIGPLETASGRLIGEFHCCSEAVSQPFIESACVIGGQNVPATAAQKRLSRECRYGAWEDLPGDGD